MFSPGGPSPQVTATPLPMNKRITITALAVLLLPSLGSAQRPHVSLGQRSIQPKPSEVIRGLQGEPLGIDVPFESAVGGTIAPPIAPSASATALLHRVYKVRIPATGTSWVEHMIVGVPDQIVGPTPVLVLFHGYGEDPEDLAFSTEYIQKARQQGWLVIAPLGAHKFNFGIEYAQRNTEVALEFLATYFPLDLDRIYGVGFSMGGGWMTSFAARHTSSDHVRFAALVNHTGTMSISHVHASAVDVSLLESPLMFAGSPFQFPFRYQRASSIDLNLALNSVDPDTDLLRNIAHTPIKTWTCATDPNLYIIDECEQFDAHLDQLGGTSDYTSGRGTGHDWSNLDEDAVLTWLAQHTRTDPDSSALVSVLADRNARWHEFQVVQRAGGAFTPFKWGALPVFNRAYVLQASNMAQVAFDPTDLGLDKTDSQGLTVVFSELDNLVTRVVLEDMNMPTNVLFNGVSTPNWGYDAITRRLTLVYLPGTQNTNAWRVLP
jgi:predicted esterase